MDSKPDHGKGSEGSNLMSASLVNWKVSQVVFCTLLAIWSLTAVAEVKTPDSPKRYMFDLPQQSVADSLNDIATQSGAQFLFPFQLAKSKTAKPITGHFTLLEATAQLLQNTGLKSDLVDGVLTISPVDDAGTSGNQNHKGKNMNTNARKTVLASMVGLFAAGGMATATAQDSVGESARAQGVLDEIIVTSTRRAESLNDAALSVAAIGGEEIDKRNLSEMNDYLRTVPGVNFIDMGVGRNSIIVRGLTLNPELEANSAGPTVGIYLGEVSIAGLSSLGGSTDLKMVDLDRVEVLRGPQGTLFGAGALGGAVRNIPNAPDLANLVGSLQADYSSTAEFGGDNHKLEGVINIPLIEDELAIRAVAYRHNTSGFVKNIAGTQLETGGPVAASYDAIEGVATFGGEDLYIDENDVGSSTYTGGRITALWKPNEHFSATLQHITQDVEQDGQPYVQLNTGGYTQVALQGGPVVGGRNEGLEDEISITNLVLEYDLGWSNVLLSSAVLKADSQFDYDITHFLAGSPAIQFIPTEQDFVSHELRFVSSLEGPLQYIVGLYYEEGDEEISSALTYATGDLESNLLGTPFGEGNPLVASRTFTQDLEQLSFYGEISYEFSDQVELTVGARRFDHKKETRDITLGAFGEADLPASFDEDGTNGKINLSYMPVDGALFYAQWSEGFRLGDTNFEPPASLCDVNGDGILDGTQAPLAPGVESDTTENFELGAKLTALDDRLQINTAIYHIDWQDIPLRVQGGKLPEQEEQTCFSPTVFNAAEARSRGFEIETLFQVSQNLSLNVGGAYTNVEIAEDSSILGASKGDRLPGSPEYNINLGLQYDFDFNGHPSYVRTDYAYISDSYSQIGEQGARSDAYGQFNMSVGTAFDNVTVDLFGNNLTNEDSVVLVTSAFPDTRAWRLRPRTIGLNVGYQF